MYKLNNFLILDLSNIIIEYLINKDREWIHKIEYRCFIFNPQNLLSIQLAKVLPVLTNFWKFSNYYTRKIKIVNNQQHPVFITKFFAKLENKKSAYIEYSHSYTEIFDLKIEEI